MNITDLLFNPESSPSESDSGFVAELLKEIVAELENEPVAVGKALKALEHDDEHRRDIGRNFGRMWDPLKDMGIVSHDVDENTAEIVREMASNPFNRLRDKVDTKSNDTYLDKLIKSDTVADSFSEKERAQMSVEAAFASTNYIPVKIPEDITEF